MVKCLLSCHFRRVNHTNFLWTTLEAWKIRAGFWLISIFRSSQSDHDKRKKRFSDLLPRDSIYINKHTTNSNDRASEIREAKTQLRINGQEMDFDTAIKKIAHIRSSLIMKKNKSIIDKMK